MSDTIFSFVGSFSSSSTIVFGPFWLELRQGRSAQGLKFAFDEVHQFLSNGT